MKLPRICDLGSTEIQKMNIQIRIKNGGWTEDQNLSDLRIQERERERERKRERESIHR